MAKTKNKDDVQNEPVEETPVEPPPVESKVEPPQLSAKAEAGEKSKSEKELSEKEKAKAKVQAHNISITESRRKHFEAECAKGPLSESEIIELAELERKARMGRKVDQPTIEEMERLAVLRVRNKKS